MPHPWRWVALALIAVLVAMLISSFVTNPKWDFGFALQVMNFRPVLNGLLHYARLDERFGHGRVIGGLCFISATKGPQGEILHLGKPASITFGSTRSSEL